MEGFRRFKLAMPFAFAASLPVSACVTLDHFAERATQYNSQVADVQDRTLLLNVMRGAHRIPMHFTELSTLVGTGTISATGTLGLPFATFHGGNGLLTATPAVTTSQSPTFNVAVLETQEFYKGMLTPLTPDQMGVYLNEGLPPELVFNLAIGQFIYQEKLAAEPQIIANNFHPPQAGHGVCEASAIGYVCFKSVLRALMHQGLTIERVREFIAIGPPLQEDAFKDPKTVKELDSQSLQVAFVDEKACKQKSPACPNGFKGLSGPEREVLRAKKSFYRVQKERVSFRFCFNRPANQQAFENIRNGSPAADRIATAQIPTNLKCRNRVVVTDTETSDVDAMGKRVEAEEPITFTSQDNMLSLELVDSGNHQPFTLNFQPRSTEGVIYYLGEIARCELRLDSVDPCAEIPKIKADYRSVPGTEDTLFCVIESKSGRDGCPPLRDTFVSVTLNRHEYSVNIDPSARDRSGQVLRVLTQLLALNRSSKDFPTPAVVPLISR